MDPSSLPPPTLPPAPTLPVKPVQLTQPPPLREKQESRLPGSTEPAEPPATLAASLRDALEYPMRKDGVIIIAGAALLSAIPLLGWVLAAVCLGFAVPYYLSVVETTISGRNDPPDWPEVSNFYESIVTPIMTVGGICWVASLPLIAYTRLFASEESSDWIVFSLESFRLLYIPMGILITVVTGSLTNAFPHRVLPAIHRTMSGYGPVLVMGLIIREAGSFIESGAFAVPFLGSALGTAVSLYLMISQARLLGLFYLRYQTELDW